MTKQEAINHFGSQRALAVALGLHEQTLQRWPDEVPARWAMAIRNAMLARAIQLEKQAQALRTASGV
jgi:DNA-binding transcriptional regulator YdaS (Cro superfamily)